MQVDGEAAATIGQGEEGVYKILTRQQVEGLEDNFLVQLVRDGKKVRRSRTELSSLAPNLLASFDEVALRQGSRSTPAAAAAAATGRTKRERTDSDVVMADDDDNDNEEGGGGGGGRPSRSSSRTSSRPKKRSTTYAENSESEEEEEASSSGEEDQDESGEFEVDSDDDDDKKKKKKQKGRRSQRSAKKQEKPRQEGTRQSSRSKGSKVNYDLGENDDDEEEDEDEMELESEEDERPKVKGRRSNEPQVEGESEDELSMETGEGRKDKGKGKEVIEVSSDDEVSTTEAREGYEDVVNENRPQDMHYGLCANAKCGKRPAFELLAAHQLKKQSRRVKYVRKKKRNEDEFDTDEEIEMDKAKGAWIECENCVSVYHFGCLTATLQKKLKTRLDSEHAKLDSAKSKKRNKVELDTEKVLKLKKCTACDKDAGTTCFQCEEKGKRVTAFEQAHRDQVLGQEGDVEMKDAGSRSQEIVPGLMFRCQSCKRTAHYGCLEPVEFQDAETTWQNHTLSYYKDGTCHDCHKYDSQWQVELDVILGWKESEKAATKPPKGESIKDKKTGKEYVLPTAKDSTYPALYLVKWKGWSYRDVDWVQHSWLSARYQLKLSNFLTKGSTVSFEPSKEDLGEDELELDAKEAAANDQAQEDYPLGPAPDPEIESRIPKAWKTVDRVIRVYYTSPNTGKPIGIQAFKTRPADDRESVKHVAKAYMKWGGLPYSQATEQEPPKEGEEGYEAYFKAYQAFIVASQREMRVPRLTPSEMAQLDAKRSGKSPVFTKQPETVKNGQLMDFQVQGLNFLLNHWWVKTGCILADEMGLGKTCQLICFLSYLNQVQKARPFLIVVPNSLVSNWLREFEKWAPELRTVAYNGDSESRRIVEQYEMFAENGDLKSHVVITTYEALKTHATVFARCTRWDCVVIDEGQALKSGEGNKLWAGLDKLRIGMKVLLTGTPLNNNLRELYNLLNFLDPEEFADVEALSDPTIEMTKERVDKIREDLRPYMLRRTKDQVLNLPPLGEFVVPVSLTILQRRLYRGILEKNSAAILNIVNNAGKSKTKAKVTTTTNTLMTLRKIVCHPYLHVPELDPGSSVPPTEAFRQLTDASAKLVLLERMLPKLREQGHKVLIFSQFKIVLNKLGPFLDGLGTKWLRLDGDTPQLDRQRDVDRFNDPNSPYSVFILSTRAGGVGLTLTSADVVIIFDQDFNPFQDMQAIARAHRIGQKNPVRVFRLVVKGTCEEKILAAGRKKQGLEHLVIQKIDAKDDETEDVSSALQYGAQAILEVDDSEAEAAAQRYTEAEIDELLSKTAEPLSEAAKENAGAFATAQVWVSEKGGLADVSQVGEQVEAEQDLGGFWDRIVAKEAQKEQEKKDLDEAATSGRSRRAKKAVNYQVPTAIVPMSEVERAKRRRGARKASGSGLSDNFSSGDEFNPRREREGSSDEFTPDFDPEDQHLRGEQVRTRPPLTRRDSRSKLSKPEEEDNPLMQLQKSKLEKRKKAIQPLIAAATDISAHDVLGTLREAMQSEDAVHQKTLILKAKRLLDEKENTSIRASKVVDNESSAAAVSTAAPPPRSADQTNDVLAPPTTSGQKRKSESPAESAQKRPKPSPPVAQPSSDKERPQSSSSKTASSAGEKANGTSSMIRSDSKGPGPADGTKKPAFSQSKLSFGPKPTSSSSSTDKKTSPTDPTSSSSAIDKPPPTTEAIASKKPASNGKPASQAKSAASSEKSKTIVISDSEED